MEAWDAAVLWAGTALLVAVLLGLFARRRLARLPSWTVYVAGLTAWQVSVLFWPALYTLRNWAVFQAFATLATLWIALEMAWRIAGRLEGAGRRLGAVLATLLWGTLAFVAAATPAAGASWPELMAVTLLPRLNVGIAACFCAIAAAAAIYAVPLDRLHRSVLLGLMIYMLLFVVVLDRLAQTWTELAWLSRLNAVSYAALLGTWAAAAWRRGEVLASVPAPVKQRWWPWAPAE